MSPGSYAPIQHDIIGWVDQVQEGQHLDWVASHRSWITSRAVPLTTPIAWLVGLWVSVPVAEHAGWPSLVTRTATSLLVAWLVIRLAADPVPYPALARLTAVVAWLMAALNIVHLPDV